MPHAHPFPSIARSTIARLVLLGLPALAVACVGTEGVLTDAGGRGGSSGNAGAGGASVDAAGTGGATAGSGGSGVSVGSGGAVGSGGSVGSGGAVGGTGGMPGTGGRGGSAATGAGGSGASGTGLPYSENFEDGMANGFVSGIDDEQAPLGTWAVVMDGATRVYREQASTDDPSWAVGGSYRWTDQHLETRLRIVSGAADALIAIAVRFSDFKSYYFLEIRNDAVKIRIRTPSTQTDLVSYSFPTELIDGTWYKFGLSAKGSSLTAFFNDAPVATVTDATLTAGGIAFGVRDAVVDFDDLTVTLPP